MNCIEGCTFQVMKRSIIHCMARFQYGTVRLRYCYQYEEKLMIIDGHTQYFWWIKKAVKKQETQAVTQSMLIIQYIYIHVYDAKL